MRLEKLKIFVIYIFRNVDLTGGKPVEKISLNELYGKKDFLVTTRLQENSV